MANICRVLYYMPSTVQGTLHIFSFNPHLSFKVGTTIIPSKETEEQYVTLPEMKPRFEFSLIQRVHSYQAA